MRSLNLNLQLLFCAKIANIICSKLRATCRSMQFLENLGDLNWKFVIYGMYYTSIQTKLIWLNKSSWKYQINVQFAHFSRSMFQSRKNLWTNVKFIRSIYFRNQFLTFSIFLFQYGLRTSNNKILLWNVKKDSYTF